MKELYCILIDFTLWPVLLSILIFLWNDLVNCVKSIEKRSVRIEKVIVRITTVIEGLIG